MNFNVRCETENTPKHNKEVYIEKLKTGTQISNEGSLKCNIQPLLELPFSAYFRLHSDGLTDMKLLWIGATFVSS
jgi:hypothetical protein